MERASACPLRKSCVPYSAHSGTCSLDKISLSLSRAFPAETFAQGRVPSGSSAKYWSHNVWTGHMADPPLQEHTRLSTPLPFCLFFLRSMRKHIVSPSRQISDCSLEAPGESGWALQVGSA